MKVATTKQFICEVCGKSFIKPSLLTRHSAAHSQLKSFRCQMCHQSFTQKASLQKHLRKSVCVRKAENDADVSSLLDESSQEPAAKRELQNLSCIYCDRNFLKPSDLQRHIRTHTNERIFNCGFLGCNKSFKLKNTLERHSTTHDDKSFTCHICSSTYTSAKILRNHMRVHSTRHVFTTRRETSKNFDTSTEKDLVTVDGTNGISTANSVLPANDTSSSAKSSQEMVEMSPSRRKLVCESCGKSFHKPVDLRRHFDAVHDKKRPFVCSFDECGKSFSLKCTLDRHLKTHSMQFMNL